jgi:hypothetical protein
MDRYWARELEIRRGQESKHSIICVTGCAYVMRKSLWQPLPLGLICDDLWSTFGVILRGQRVGIEPDAFVVDPRRFTREQEYARRLRTMTGLLQFLREKPSTLNPVRNPIFGDLLLHKLARPLTPLLLVSFAVGMVFWLGSRWPTTTLYTGIGVATIVAVLLSARPLLPETAQRGVNTLQFAVRLAMMPLRALRQAYRSDWDVWHSQGHQTSRASERQ